MLKLKHCPICDLVRAQGCFYRDASRRDGLANKCSDCAKAMGRRHYQNNTEKVKGWARRRPVEARRESVQQWKARNPDRDLAYERDARERLTDGYVRQTLAVGTPLRAAQIPQSLVEAKRLQLQIHRLIKEQENEVG